MKLSRMGTLATALVVLAGCASGGDHRAVAPIATTQLTSADIGQANAPTPRIGKAQHAVGDEQQDELEPKRPMRTDAPKKRGSFGGWK